jgi:hypothetical protein
MQGHDFAHPNANTLEMLRKNLTLCSTTEQRYLLVLTEDCANLSILQQEIPDFRDAIVIFGSSFPKDLEYTQVSKISLYPCYSY